MVSPAITTLVKMVESLPEPMQEKAVEKMREYLEELESDRRWDEPLRKHKTGWSLLQGAPKSKSKQGNRNRSTLMNYEIGNTSVI